MCNVLSELDEWLVFYLALGLLLYYNFFPIFFFIDILNCITDLLDDLFMSVFILILFHIIQVSLENEILSQWD